MAISFKSKLNNWFDSAHHKSFTLIELLIVIAILALLMSIIIITLNPADLLKQTRDTKRISQVTALNNAITIFQANKPSTSLGAANKVYVSVPDSDSSCANLSLPPLPSGYTYACSTTANYKKTDGTGWVPINFNSLDIGSPLSVLPTDPTNATSSGLYFTFTTDSNNSYELVSIVESDKRIQETTQTDGGDSDNGFEKGSNLTLAPLTFPNNWIQTPNNFWVMKYEAKYSKAGNGSGDNVGGCYYDVLYDTWDFGKVGTDCPSSWSNTNFVSSAKGSTVAGITHTQAVTACQALGAHVIYNSEWMQIARDAEQQDQNWSSGKVGTGCLFRGNVGTADACGYNGADPEKGENRNSKAKFTLSNNKEIWDIAGNVWEHVLNTSADTLIRYQPSDGGAIGFRWVEHSNLTSYGDLSYNAIRPSNTSWNATYGMGRVYTYNGDYGATDRVLGRGGDWSDGADDGAFTMRLSWTTGAQGSDIGFRCSR
jgi:prepilin-type N-terminal cleavage/methylation domain-containing protein